MTEINPKHLDPYSVEDTINFIHKLNLEIKDMKKQIKRKEQYIKVAKKHLTWLRTR